MIIYRGIYKDVEETTQATKRIDIIDRESNPYNIAVTSEVVGSNIVFTFTFDTLPAAATGTSIGYSSDGGITWSSSTGGVTSPRTLTVPNGAYELTFTIQLPTGNLYWSEEDEIIELEMTDDPVRDVVIDNAENIHTVIRARMLEIQIYSSNGISIDIFSQGGDNRFSVKWYIDDVLHFTGWLSMGDSSQQILPDPNVILLTATDGLGFLSDIPLMDFDGNNPEGERDLLTYLLWSLSLTGLELNIAAMFNIREETALDMASDATGEGHIFKFNFLDAKTWEDQVNTSINAYEVLERLLYGCYLFQWLGEWRIIRVDEMEFTRLETYYRWRSDGEFISKAVEVNEHNVGVGEDYSWMNDDAERSNQRLIRELRLKYGYVLPLETPCNKDFERGDIITDTPTVKTYDIECWQKLWSDTLIDKQQDTGIYIRREFVDDYEKERYVVLEADANLTFIKSSRIFCGVKDKFTIDISRRLSTDVGGSGFYREAGAVQVRLYGNDGTFWTHHGKTSADERVYWTACTSTFRTFQEFYVIEGNANEVQTETKGLYSGETAEIPVAGYLQILIFRSNLYGDTRDTYIDSLTFDYLAFVNGSYRKYTSQQHIVTQTVQERGVLERENFIDNSPSRQYKGALLIGATASLIYSGEAIFSTPDNISLPGDVYSLFPVGMEVIIGSSVSNNVRGRVTLVQYNLIPDRTTILLDTAIVNEVDAAITISMVNYALAGLFYNAATSPTGPDFPKPYGEILAFDIWNQNNRTIAKFEGTADHSNPPPGMQAKYFMSDFSLTRMFILLHYEYDSHLCEWEAFFMECSNFEIYKQYTGHSFKYLTNE